MRTSTTHDLQRVVDEYDRDVIRAEFQRRHALSCQRCQDSMRDAGMLVDGGQGRTEAELQDAATRVFWVCISIALLMWGVAVWLVVGR